MDCKLIENVRSRRYSESSTCTWFYRGIIREQWLFPLCRQDIPSILVPSEFFAIFEVQTSQKEIIARLADYAFSKVAQRTHFRERNALRSEKERPWGLRTYRPFRGQLQDAKPSFTEMLKIAEEVIDEIAHTSQIQGKTQGIRLEADFSSSHLQGHPVFQRLGA